MDPRILAATFLVVMAGAAGCFVAAFARRRTRRTHIRLALTGAAIDVAATIDVVVTARGFDLHVPARFPDVALVHRGFAYVATCLLALQAATGFARSRAIRPWAAWHGPAAVVFLPVYLTTYVLALAPRLVVVSAGSGSRRARYAEGARSRRRASGRPRTARARRAGGARRRRHDIAP